jgi:hypothetical protein
MPKKLTINTHLPAIPSWLKIDNTLSFPLPLKKAKELAKKLSEVEEDVEIAINLSSGKEARVEIIYESQKDGETAPLKETASVEETTPIGETKTHAETPEEG